MPADGTGSAEPAPIVPTHQIIEIHPLAPPAPNTPLASQTPQDESQAPVAPTTCDSCNQMDEHQIGAGIPTYHAETKSLSFPDQKGRRYEVPIGDKNIGVSYKAGSGIWLRDFGPATNLYLKPNKDNLSLGIKVDF